MNTFVSVLFSTFEYICDVSILIRYWHLLDKIVH
jgi:hypothetical protein